jgi:CRISPR/Cas system-associated endoribonuclease Cas2
MANYILTYDVKASRDSMIEDELKKRGLIHTQDSVWLLDSPETPDKIMNNLKKLFNEPDEKVFFATLDNIHTNIKPVSEMMSGRQSLLGNSYNW